MRVAYKLKSDFSYPQIQGSNLHGRHYANLHVLHKKILGRIFYVNVG